MARFVGRVAQGARVRCGFGLEPCLRTAHLECELCEWQPEIIGHMHSVLTRQIASASRPSAASVVKAVGPWRPWQRRARVQLAHDTDPVNLEDRRVPITEANPLACSLCLHERVRKPMARRLPRVVLQVVPASVNRPGIGRSSENVAHVSASYGSARPGACQAMVRPEAAACWLPTRSRL